jgi:SanA protein
MKHLVKLIVISISITLLLIICCDLWITFSSKNQLFDSINNLPHNKVGMILGTSRYLSNGKPNLYFKNRMDAGILLFKKKKIDFILVSGDNRKVNYNEPKQMTLYLLSKGIPEHRIIQDYGGRRTLDSVIRGNLIFDLTQFTIISQEFHNERAVFIANNHNLNVVGFNAKPVLYNTILSLNNRLREYLARVKAVFDILLNIQPEIGGNKEPILVS